MTDQAMTTTNASTTPRGTQSGYTLEHVNRAGEHLSSKARPDRPLTAAEALFKLAGKLKKKKEEGHSFADLVKYLGEIEMHFSERQVIRAVRAASASKPARKKPATSAT